MSFWSLLGVLGAGLWQQLPGTATPFSHMHYWSRRQRPWAQAAPAQRASVMAAHHTTLRNLRAAHASVKLWSRLVDFVERRERDLRVVQLLLFPVLFWISIERPAWVLRLYFAVSEALRGVSRFVKAHWGI